MSKEILILTHVDIEGPGTMEEFFRGTDWHVRVVDVIRDGLKLEDLWETEAVISLGGPMNVYEEGKYPFLKDEDEFMRRALSEEIPVLGICLGAQILAKACGANVKKMPQEEIGWHKVMLTDEGRKDALFEGLPSEMDVFQWHEDTFDIPRGGLLLAGSRVCPHQAFRIGRNAYGLQFHVEVTPLMVESWTERYGPKETPRFDPRGTVIESYKREQGFEKQAYGFYLNFAKIVAKSEKTRIF